MLKFLKYSPSRVYSVHFISYLWSIPRSKNCIVLLGFCQRHKTLWLLDFVDDLNCMKENTYRRVVNKIAHHVSNQGVIPDDMEKNPRTL